MIQVVKTYTYATKTDADLLRSAQLFATELALKGYTSRIVAIKNGQQVIASDNKSVIFVRK